MRIAACASGSPLEWRIRAWHIAPVRDFRNLRAWRSAQAFIRDVYAVTAEFPVDERFGLTQQLRRAAVSIASNIAEGCGRDTDADMARFLTIATGSASECESQIVTTRSLGMLDGAQARKLIDDVEHLRRQIHNFKRALRER